MRNWCIIAALTGASLGLSGCGQGAAAQGPVTPTAASPRAPGWKPFTMVKGLDHPWALAFLPDGDMLITERTGRLRIVRDGKLVKEPIAGTPSVLAKGQGGLLDIALHPAFAENKLVYLTYSHGTAGANRTRLARAKFDGSALTDFEVIFDAAPEKSGALHFGSRILFLPDGTMLVSIGEGFNYRDEAQNVNVHLGKVVRLNDDGTPANGNPFLAREGAKPEVWTYGHRNIQGMALDTAGRVWTTEHGPRGGDELNLLEPGANYGWPLATYGREYYGPKISDHASLPGMNDPKVVWVPCIAPSGLALYAGDKFPQWRGDLFAGGLVLRQVRRIDLDDSGAVIGQQTLVIGQRVRDVRCGPDGFLYVLTDEDKGELIRIEPE